MDEIVWVNDDPIGNNRMQFQDLVWTDFNTDGELFITERNRRNAPDSIYATSSEIWAAVRWKDSTQFSPNCVISDSITAFNNVLLSSGNDFLCVVFENDTANVVWGDVRTGTVNVPKEFNDGNHWISCHKYRRYPTSFCLSQSHN